MLPLFSQLDGDFATTVHSPPTIAFVPQHAVPNRSINVPLQDFKNMVDLRPLLASGNLDDVAHNVLERLSSMESIAWCRVTVPAQSCSN
jgi:hypothetical protein